MAPSGAGVPTTEKTTASDGDPVQVAFCPFHPSGFAGSIAAAYLCTMNGFLRKWHLVPGLTISFSLAVIVSLRKLYRTEDVPVQQAVFQIGGAFLFTLSCWFTHHYIHRTHFRYRLLNRPGIKVAMALFVSVLLSAFLAPFILDRDVKHPYFAILVRSLVLGGFQYFMVYYITVLEVSHQSKLEIEKLKHENVRARLQSLTQQVSPHFLFNSLSTLRTMVQDPLSRNYISQLAQVYRYLLNHKQQELATVTEELQFLEAYAYILKERFEDALRIKIHPEHISTYKKIPPISLQLLLENAVKHNVVSKEDPLTIHIYEEEDFLSVENNRQPRRSVEESSSGKGLQNIDERCRLLCGRGIVIYADDTVFKVKIPLA
ncbi:sensor histidine kinase [Parasegetibacter sp. NRK P23]|uniref:sensor histidine kinase n=1 Tax=Parasegetibacter sp. NRK P23 TaxID=2942999 RepID=UPI002043EC25|nr:histidine kinase [Parasegetibacter sp. NRK P23]MCM5528773.1 histidine kinase [Parasegetibacter sp. NRK P23]